MRKRLTEWAIVIVIAVGLAIGLRGFALQAFYVPSGSMIPALQIGDRILVNKLFFSASSLGRGTIVVLHHPPADASCGPPSEDLVKRVIATGGQTISSNGNKILINDQVIKETYLPKVDPLGSTPITRQKIPKGEVFLLGDNRAISCDSRFWGPISTKLIVGDVAAIWWRSGHPYLHLF